MTERNGSVFLSQTGETVKELGTFCTWKRINEFKKMTEWLLLKILIPFTPIVIISDGAKWIRNLRNKIPGLKKSVMDTGLVSSQRHHTENVQDIRIN